MLPAGRFGVLDIHGEAVTGFTEKPHGEGGRINGGFFVLEPAALDYATGDDVMWEQAPMRGLVADGQLAAYPHDGFWQPMDTLRDKEHLEALWAQPAGAPWRKW